VDGDIDETKDIGKKKSKIIELNEIAYIDFISLIEDKTRSGKIAFNIIRWCKTNNHQVDDPVSASLMVKLEKQFSDLTLKKGQYPDIWITELENIYVKPENMVSWVTENQIMIHILNNITSEYDLQFALMERGAVKTNKPFTDVNNLFTLNCK
jgi:hypothetical protein